MQKNEAQERLISVPDLKEVRQWTGTHNASNHSFGLVVGRFNYGLTSCLLETVVETLVAQGAEPGRIDVTWVPGSFEIPLVIKRLAGVSQYSALIALGAASTKPFASFKPRPVKERTSLMTAILFAP